MERQQRAATDTDSTTDGAQKQRQENSDNIPSAHSESTPNMADVADLTDRVINVSLDEVSSPDTSAATIMVSNTQSPLPQREVNSKPHRTRSATSFVSCPSTPCDSVTTVPKSIRLINTYFAPINKTMAPIGTVSKGSTKSDNTKVTAQPRPVTPNILEGLILDSDAIAPLPNMTSTQENSEEDLRGAKRKRNTSAPTNNYESIIKHNNAQNNPMQSLDMDELSKQLFIESGRPAITITSRVSDNRSTDSNALSVSFQIPAQNPDQGAEADSDSDVPAHIDLSKIQADPGTPWMKPIEQTYYNTARSSVVAEIRAQYRSRMLTELTNNKIIAPWALSLAPMPVYLHPHAAAVAELMKKSALDFQLRIADLLHDQAEFQSEKVKVDRVSLQGIFGDNQDSYRLSIGALFDARRKVQSSIKEQMDKYVIHLSEKENQVSDKEIVSMVRGLVPKKYSYATNMELPTSMDPPPADRQVDNKPVQERGRARSRSRSRRRGRSSSRPAKRRNYQQQEQPDRDYGFGNRQQQQYNNPPRPQMGGGARPKERPQPEYNQRMDTGGMDPSFFTPELIKKIAEAYDGLHK